MTARVQTQAWVGPVLVCFVAACLGVLAGLNPALAIGAVFGLAFVLVATVNLRIGVAVVSFLAFTEILPGVGGLSAAKVAGGVVVLSWIAATTTANRPVRQFFGAHPSATLLICVFLAWVTAGVAWAEAPSQIGSAMVRYVPDTLLFALMFSAVRSGSDARSIVFAFLTGALLSTVYGAFIAPGDPDAAAAGRVSGAGVDPNQLAAGLVAGVSVCAATALDRERGGGVRLASMSAVLLFFFALVTTASRTGIIAMVAACLVAVPLSGPGRRLPAFILMIFVLGLGTAYVTQAAPAEARQRLTDFSGGGGSGRTSIWKVATKVVDAHPIGGVGSGNFPIVSKEYLFDAGQIDRSDFIIDDPLVVHNTYLEIWAENGFIGFVLFVSLVVWVLSCGMRAARRFREVGDRSLELLSRSIVIGTCGMLAAAFFLSQEHQKAMWIMFAMSPALLKVSRRDPDEGTLPVG